jgi:hypothetical protein
MPHGEHHVNSENVHSRRQPTGGEDVRYRNNELDISNNDVREQNKTSPDNLSYSLPPISSLETSRQRTKGDSSTVLKRLRKEDISGGNQPDNLGHYNQMTGIAGLERRRSLSDPLVYG